VGKERTSTVIIFLLAISIGITAFAEDTEYSAFKYPVHLTDTFNPENDCWTGMDINGDYPTTVIPEIWLVGEPLSEVSGVTFRPDHWIELQFRGPIVDGPGDDIIITEIGPASEHALVFLTDGRGQEYLLGEAVSGSTGGGVEPIEIYFDISDLTLPFEPRAIRIVALDYGGTAPGFDIGNVLARTSIISSPTAGNPYPPDNSKNISIDSTLDWVPGNYAEEHYVYLSTNINDFFSNASGINNPAQPQDSNIFNPGLLEFDKTYYWRVDEINETDVNSPWTGNIWKYKTSNNFVIDDFESYYNNSDLYQIWSQNNSRIDITNNQSHSCFQSMEFSYYYSSDSNEKVILNFDHPQDWKSANANILELFFYGQSYNDIDNCQMYIAIGDEVAETIIPFTGNPNNLRKEIWQQWEIDLRNITEIDISRIKYICIGLRNDPNQSNTIIGSGNIYIDDIKLYSSICLQKNRPIADLNCDCIVNFEDFTELSYTWLDSGYNEYPVTEPNSPLLWYTFDGRTLDLTGNSEVQVHGNPNYTLGFFGQAINFDGQEDYIEVTQVENSFSQIENGITICFWQYGKDSQYHRDTIICSDYEYNVYDPSISINLGCWKKAGRYNWDCGSSSRTSDKRLSGNHRYKSEWAEHWNHWAFTKDATTGIMQIYLNGKLYDSRMESDRIISPVNSFTIGNGWYGYYDGLLDDLKIYDYVLTQPEIVYSATNGTGIFNLLVISPADLLPDNIIDFNDLGIIAEHWLENNLHP